MQPNIVFICTDHTNAAAIAPAGQCLTPALDALASDGVRIARCYTTNAICSPARASLMTATYPSTHGVWDCTHTQRKTWVDIAPGLDHWAQHLAEDGYVNGYFGKWHVEQSGTLDNFGWHEYDIRCGGAARPADAARRVVVSNEGYDEYCLAAAGTDSERSHPAFEKGMDFIDRQAADAQPFCCFISTGEPHDTYVPPKDFLDLYDIEDVRVSPTLHDDLAGKPEVLKRMAAVWKGMSEQDWRFTSACYWALISWLDSQVARVVEQLRRLDLYDNTIVVFTSDHGDMLGGHGLATKGVGTSYEEVYNVPLVMRVPGAAARGEDAAPMVSIVDIGPTLLDLCDAGPLPNAQGRSMRGVLDGPLDPADWQDAYAEFFGQRFVYTQRIVWHGDWKYVFSPGGIDELYDLAEDPGEMNNRIGDADYRDILRQMVRRMWRMTEQIDDRSLRNARYATLRTAPFGPDA